MKIKNLILILTTLTILSSALAHAQEEVLLDQSEALQDLPNTRAVITLEPTNHGSANLSIVAL